MKYLINLNDNYQRKILEKIKLKECVTFSSYHVKLTRKKRLNETLLPVWTNQMKQIKKGNWPVKCNLKIPHLEYIKKYGKNREFIPVLV